MTTEHLHGLIDQLAAEYSVPWCLRDAFKGAVLGLLKEWIEDVKEGLEAEA